MTDDQQTIPTQTEESRSTRESKNGNFKDAAKLDKRIPRELLMKYQDKWYILKAGLEWKAAYLYGANKYGVETEIIDRKPDCVVAKATFRYTGGFPSSNFGEASKENVSNPRMHSQLLHLAVTRAECRVLRMVTACGYVSVEEMDFSNNGKKELPPSATDGEKITAAQLSELNRLIDNGKIDRTVIGGELEDLTQKDAKELFAQVINKK